MKYAGFWLRVVAAIIDGIILNVAQFISGTVAWMALGEFHGLNMQAIFFFIWLIYGILMESSKYQATLGKMALGLKVTDLNGKRISFGRAVGRTFAKLLSWFTIGIGYIMAAFTQKKQGLHDMVAGTLVVRAKA